jgi:hypothetical protein
MREGDTFYRRGWDGLLVYDFVEAHGMHAILYDVESGEEKMRLYSARVVKARDGGLLITGEERKFRGLKSKGEAWRQSWWCVPAFGARKQA